MNRNKFQNYASEKRDCDALHGSFVEIRNEADFKRVKDFINSHTSDADKAGE